MFAGEELPSQRFAKLVQLFAYLTGEVKALGGLSGGHGGPHKVYGVRMCYEKLQAKIQVDDPVSVFDS